MKDMKSIFCLVQRKSFYDKKN